MKKSKYYLQERALELVQATLGAISNNFRIISISEIDKGLKITIILEHESEIDREEINDIASEFEALQETAIEYELETIITDSEIIWPPPDTIVTYRRKEL